MDDKMNDVIDEVQRRLGEEYEVKRVEVMKNNAIYWKLMPYIRLVGKLEEVTDK